MWPWESSHTPCVLPYLILAGSSPQSWVTSYLWSPSPRMGLAEPDLFAARRMIGADTAAPAVCMNSLLVAFSMPLLYHGEGDCVRAPPLPKANGSEFRRLAGARSAGFGELSAHSRERSPGACIRD